jgi:hypothetical protein
MHPLPDRLAAAADDAIDRTIKAAALAVTAGKRELPDALMYHWAVLARDFPEVYGLCVVRLQQTGNEDHLMYAVPSHCDD